MTKVPLPKMAMRAALAVAVVAALVLAVGCNVIQLKQARIEAALYDAGMRPTRRHIGDSTVRWWDGGSGQPLLLLHGFGASAIWQWHEQIPALVKDHRVVMPDLLWFGDSFSASRDFTLDHQVRMVTALMKRLGIEQADFMGISYGGLVAYELASSQPKRVRRLVIVDSPGRAYTREDYDSLLARLGVKHLGAVLLPEHPRGLDKLLALAHYDPPWVPGWALKQAHALLYKRYRKEKVALLDAMLEDLTALSNRPDPRAPTLLIWGSHDPVFPLAIGKRLEKRLAPHARLEVIDKAKHAPNLEHPEKFNSIVVPFLRR